MSPLSAGKQTHFRFKCGRKLFISSFLQLLSHGRTRWKKTTSLVLDIPSAL